MSLSITGIFFFWAKLVVSIKKLVSLGTYITANVLTSVKKIDWDQERSGFKNFRRPPFAHAQHIGNRVCTF